MRSIRYVCIMLMVLFIGFGTVAQAEVEKGGSRTFNLQAKPIDMATSADGKYTYILAEGGKVLIVDQRGEVKDTLKVKDTVVSIGTTPKGDFLLLADSEAQTLEVMKINFIVDIDVSNLPFKGPADAPVVVAVFSDYQ